MNTHAKFFLLINQERQGPYSWSEVVARLTANSITAQTPCREEDTLDWSTVADIRLGQDGNAQTAHQAPPQRTISPTVPVQEAQRPSPNRTVISRTPQVDLPWHAWLTGSETRRLFALAALAITMAVATKLMIFLFPLIFIPLIVDSHVQRSKAGLSSYKWGYILGMSLFGGGLMFPVVTTYCILRLQSLSPTVAASALASYAINGVLMGAPFGILGIIVGYYVLLRRRWAVITATATVLLGYLGFISASFSSPRHVESQFLTALLFLSPFIIITTFVATRSYLRNRKDEFLEKANHLPETKTLTICVASLLYGAAFVVLILLGQMALDRAR